MKNRAEIPAESSSAPLNYSSTRHQVGREVLVFESLESSNSYLLDSGLPAGTAVIARRQSQARGRMGRRWFNNQDNLSFSFVLSPPPAAQQTASLTLWIGLAILRTLKQDYAIDGLRIKWPNDILLEGKKLCGVLCEAKQGQTSADIVVGIGLNLNNLPAHFPADLADQVASLRWHTNQTYDTLKMAEHIMDQCETLLLQLATNPAAPEDLREEWIRSSGMSGQRLSFTEGERECSGVFDGLDETGGIQIVLPSGECITRYSGEIRLHLRKI